MTDRKTPVPGTQPPKNWCRLDGTTVACTEKVKVLEENWEEMKELFQNVLDDAILMGCTVEQVKREYRRLIEETVCNYEEQTGAESHI